MPDAQAQQMFEQRTGWGHARTSSAGVDATGSCDGILKKRGQLARRIPFQRALAARDLQLLAPPELVRYRSIEGGVG